MNEVRVLIVDDQAPFRRAMATVVEMTEGFVLVGSAASGEDALLAAGDLVPDLVLIDLNLPGIDGVEVSRRLTGEPGAPAVVLLSTYDGDQVDIAGCGAVAYIPKAAFGPDSLSAAWQRAARTADQG